MAARKTKRECGDGDGGDDEQPPAKKACLQPPPPPPPVWIPTQATPNNERTKRELLCLLLLSHKPDGFGLSDLTGDEVEEIAKQMSCVEGEPALPPHWKRALQGTLAYTCAHDGRFPSVACDIVVRATGTRDGDGDGDGDEATAQVSVIVTELMRGPPLLSVLMAHSPPPNGRSHRPEHALLTLPRDFCTAPNHTNGLVTLSMQQLGLRWLPEEIAQLRSLRYLNVARNLLSELPNTLVHLTALTHLDVTGNRLARLSPSLPRLLTLIAPQNRGIDVSELCGFGALRVVDLRNTDMSKLPNMSSLPDLKCVRLGGNPNLETPPLVVPEGPRAESQRPFW